MYDIIILGGGPAGCTAGVYAARYNLKTLIISKDVGGWVNTTPYIENFPAEPKAVPGYELGTRFKEQVKNLGAELVEDEIESVEKQEHYIIKTKSGKEFSGEALVYALGGEKRRLGVPGEEEFLGKGVFFCVTCDGPMFRDRVVAVAGGGDSAVLSALMLTEYAEKVYMFVRDPELTARPHRADLANENPKIEILYNTSVKEIKGEKFVESVVLDNGKELKLKGLFIEIGMIPRTEFAENLGVELDHGLIKVNNDMTTNVEKLYAAGDLTTGSDRLAQIVTAAAEGAIAAHAAYRDLKGKK